MKTPPFGAKDLIGRAWGRVKVIGYFESSKEAGSKWVIRCACGGFETRRSRAVEAANPEDMCVKCNRVETLKKRARAIARGKNEDGSPLGAGLQTATGRLTLKDMGITR